MRDGDSNFVPSTRDLYRVVLVSATGLLAVVLLWPFVPALTGVALLAMVTHRPFGVLNRFVRNRTLAAILGVMCVSLCLVAPVAFVANRVLQNAVQAITFFRSPVFSDSALRAIATVNGYTGTHSLLGIEMDLSSMFNRLVSFLASSILTAFSGSLAALTQIVAMLFLLFFWYRDGYRLEQSALRSLPLSNAEMRFLGGHLRDVVKGTVFGRFAVAAVQGVLAWVTYLILGLPGAPLLGSLTAICAIFPAVGAYLVWLPVALYLALVHAWMRALVLTIIGTALLSTVDNLLFPVLAGSKTRMGTPQMFLSLFGGVWAFGVCGLILGPVIWNLAESMTTIVLRRPRSIETETDRVVR